MFIMFTKNCPPYNAGERATFSDEQGQRYIDAGAAALEPEPAKVFSVSPEAISDVQKVETPITGMFTAKRGRK